MQLQAGEVVRMRRWAKTIVAFILGVSLMGNLWLYMEYHRQQDQIREIQETVSRNIERNIRQSMRQIDFLIESESPESLHRLQGSIEDLTGSFTQWALMNQTEQQPNERLKLGLGAMESLRNTLVDQLNRQYLLQEQKIAEPDRVMLLKVYDHLDRFLLIYHNIHGRLDELKNPAVNDGGLSQMADQIIETTMLYRHAATPNQHPSYLAPEIVRDRAVEQLEFMGLVDINLVNDRVTVHEGVHTYDFQLIMKEGSARAGVDARDGTVRSFTLDAVPAGEKKISRGDALSESRQILSAFYKEAVKEEFLLLPQNSSENPVYVFRFTPVTDQDIVMTSDAFQVTVSAVDGQLVQLSNAFSFTQVPEFKLNYTIDELHREKQPELGRMVYNGRSIIRTFNTRFQPRLTYVFRVFTDGQPNLRYYDVETGVLIHEMHDMFQLII
jgi:hypothetical protein